MNNLMLNVHLLQFCFFCFFQRYLSLSLLFKCGYIFLTECNIMFGLTYSVPFYWTSSGLLNVYCTFNLIKIFLNAKKSRKFRFFHFRICEKLWESSSMFYWLIYMDIFQDRPWSSKNCSKTNGEKFPITWSLES